MNSTFGPAIYNSNITGAEQPEDAVTAVVPTKITKWWITGSPWVTYASLVFAYSSGIIGTAANILVLVVIIRARRQSGTGVNTLIIKPCIVSTHQHPHHQPVRSRPVLLLLQRRRSEHLAAGLSRVRN